MPKFKANMTIRHNGKTTYEGETLDLLDEEAFLLGMAVASLDDTSPVKPTGKAVDKPQDLTANTTETGEI
jgi:hypothetical protein